MPGSIFSTYLGDSTDDAAASGNCSVSEERFDCSETGVSGVSRLIDNVIL